MIFENSLTNFQIKILWYWLFSLVQIRFQIEVMIKYLHNIFFPWFELFFESWEIRNRNLTIWTFRYPNDIVIKYSFKFSTFNGMFATRKLNVPKNNGLWTLGWAKSGSLGPWSRVIVNCRKLSFCQNDPPMGESFWQIKRKACYNTLWLCSKAPKILFCPP